MNLSSPIRIALFGGGFDPIHIGHLILAQTALETLELNQVIFMPSGGLAHYKKESNVAPGSDRVEMVRLAIAANPHFAVSSFEVDQKHFVFTFDTLRYLQSTFPPDTEIILLVGGDWIDKIPTWKNGDLLLQEFPVALFSRPGSPSNHTLQPPVSGNRILQVDMPLIDISSSQIRERLRKGLSIQYWVSEPVRQYIINHHLYHS